MQKLKTYLVSLKTWAGIHPWTTAIIAVVVIGGGIWMSTGNKAPSTDDVVIVKRGTISQIISVTGKVKPASEVDLSFERSGRITGVNVTVGTRVGAGTLLASLDGGDVAAQLEQARAAVRSQEAQLQELQTGASTEDIAVSEVEVKNAQNDVTTDAQSAVVTADDTLHNKIDLFFSNGRSTTPQLMFSVADSQLETDLETGRFQQEATLTIWKNSQLQWSDGANADQAITVTKTNLRALQSYLDKAAIAVNSVQPSTALSQTTIDTYKAAVLSARTNVSAEMTSINASEEKLRTAQSRLALKKVSTSSANINAQIANVDAAKANVRNLEAQLGRTVIRSPIAGVVTKVEAKKGEIASTGTIVFSVISDARYEIEAFVPEADIAKIKVGNTANVTLDAYGSDTVFEAVAVRIDPAETMIDGVATYKTVLQFKKDDSRIKSGMTANTDINGESRENVLILPARAIKQKDNVKTVTLIEGETTREVEITTGLRGSEGDVEVVSGLEEGNTVQLN